MSQDMRLALDTPFNVTTPRNKVAQAEDTDEVTFRSYVRSVQALGRIFPAYRPPYPNFNSLD